MALNDTLKALVIDDETHLRRSLVELVESEGFAAAEAKDGLEALEILRKDLNSFDVIFLDLRMPRLNGLALLERMRDEALEGVPVIVISAYGDSAQTIEAMRLGAYDYLTKPIEIDDFLLSFRRAAEQRRLNQQAKAMRSERSIADVSGSAAENPAGPASVLIGTSRAMRDIFKQVGRLAAIDATVLITGESGTGKELVAQAIHNHSARATKPFVAVNCGALPENLIEAELFGHERGAFTGADRQKKGKFELAHTGTLFLDEVGELSPGAQVKLLRALQERKIERLGGAEPVGVDVRVIAATNRDLKLEVEERRFREDLFYRLAVVDLSMPALRSRPGDIEQLADYFIERAALRNHVKPKLLSDAALRTLLSFPFPGNVRELENMIERAMVASNGDMILPEHLGLAMNRAADDSIESQNLLALPFKEAVAQLERLLITRALRDADNNRAEAARRLGINRRLLYSKLEEYGIK